MDYSQLREILVNTESLYNLWKSTGLEEEEFIRANGRLIEDTEKARLQKASAKARQIKFLDKQKAVGKRFLSALVSSETYDLLCRERDRAIQAGSPKNIGEVIDELLTGSKPDQKRPIVEIQTEIPAPAPTLVQDQADKPDVLEIIALHRKAGLTWQAIATALNEQGILTARGGAWKGPNCQTFFTRSNK